MKWFRSKPKNRRFERDNVLDVKMHSKHVRSVRARVIGTVFAAVSGTVLGGLVLWHTGKWALNHFIYTNPTFAVQRIDIQTDGVLPLDRLRDWTGVKKGDNLLAVDLHQLKRNLELNSLVHRAAVDRVYPGTLWVRITEREPIARFTFVQARFGDGNFTVQSYYLDQYGIQIPQTDLPELTPELTQHLEHLPVLAGVDLRDFSRGNPELSARIRDALQFIQEFSRSPMAQVADLQEVSLRNPGVLEARTYQNTVATIAPENVGLQLHRWRKVHDRVVAMNKSLVTLDLSVTNNLPARLLEASAAPVPAPKTNLTSRYRKKHV